MNRRMKLKQQIGSGKPTLGSWITLGHCGIAEIMANAGFDWLVVDLEHSTISIDMAGDLIRTIDLCGVAPLVRLTSNEPNQIKRVMDAGAHGIVVPMVNTPEDALKAVAAVRYAPEGNRGVGLARAQGYGENFQEYLKWQKDQSVVIAQIEHKDALDNLEDILRVPGIDAFIVGPYDLSCSMGIPGEFEHPEFLAAMDLIVGIGKKLDSPAGLHIVEPDNARLERCLQEGYRFLAYSVDIRIISAGVTQGIRTFQEVTK